MNLHPISTARRVVATMIVALAASLTTQASDFVVDGIAYNINSDSTSVTVVATNLRAADNYAGLTSAVIPRRVNPDSVSSYLVTAIDEFAFYGCTTLESVSIPSSVDRIGDRAFAHCPSIRNIEVNASNRTFDSRNNCNAIVRRADATIIAGCSSTTMNYTITAIDAFAFSGCTNLMTLRLPSALSRIGYEAFEGCTSLMAVALPASLSEIGYRVFAGCDNLSEITVNPGNSLFSSPDDCNAVVETASGTIVATCSKSVIPAGVKRIGYEAFSGCGGLTSYVIPDSVTRIGHYAFRNTTTLGSIDIPATVDSFGDRAFAGCTALRTIVSRIEQPDQASYYLLNTFEDVDTLECNVYVPSGTVDLYKATMPWQPFFHILPIPSNLRGDVNNDGVVDVVDVSILINIVLGKDSADKYERRAYILGNDYIDVTDVNALINIILNS